MKARHFSILLVISSAFAQIPNSGFENWTAAGNYEDPNGWGTTNSLSTGSFHAVTKVADPYPLSVGNYSARIESNTSLLSDYSGLGTMMTGALAVPYPIFPIIGHPTSFTGYWLCL